MNILEESVEKVNQPKEILARPTRFLLYCSRQLYTPPRRKETPVKELRIRTVFLSAATVSVTAILVIVFAAFFEYFHIGGSEFPWADPADSKAAVTVEVYDRGTKQSETYELTRGQGTAMQSLLLRTHYLRRTSGSLSIKDGSRVYTITIRLPDKTVSYQLFDGVNGLYLLGSSYHDWLKILDPEWNTAFQGILTAG